MSAVGEAAGRDLTSWTTDWFDRAGTDTLTLTLSDGELRAEGPRGEEPRPHRVDIGSFSLARRRPAPGGHHARGDERRPHPAAGRCRRPTSTCPTTAT